MRKIVCQRFVSFFFFFLFFVKFIKLYANSFRCRCFSVSSDDERWSQSYKNVVLKYKKYIFLDAFIFTLYLEPSSGSSTYIVFRRCQDSNPHPHLDFESSAFIIRPESKARQNYFISVCFLVLRVLRLSDFRSLKVNQKKFKFS